MKKALITGVTGQDRAYLAEFLLEKGYEVHGVKRRASFNTQRIDHSFRGVAKNYAYWITVNYREAYNMFACNGILFSHESPLRAETFATRKITMATAKIALGLQDTLYIGKLNSQRDWGHAKDYIEAMWLILQQDKPEDFVISTGKTTHVREFVRMTFLECGIELEFVGENENEVGKVKSCSNPKYQLEIGIEVVKVDPNYYRPTEVDLLIGDSSKARTVLGWKLKFNLDDIVKQMIAADIELFEKEIK